MNIDILMYFGKNIIIIVKCQILLRFSCFHTILYEILSSLRRTIHQHFKCLHCPRCYLYFPLFLFHRRKYRLFVSLRIQSMDIKNPKIIDKILRINLLKENPFKYRKNNSKWHLKILIHLNSIMDLINLRQKVYLHYQNCKLRTYIFIFQIKIR